MSVLFSLLVIICGVAATFNFCFGNIMAGFTFTAVGLLSIAGLSAKVLAGKKKQDTAENQVEAIKSLSASSTSEQLIELKKLLDAGIITQEDFDAKKKDILKL